jgi:hypothetical protein
MTIAPMKVRLRTTSPTLRRAWTAALAPSDEAARRRLGWVWGLLLFDVLTYTKSPGNLIPLPSLVGKGLAAAALGVALVLVLTVNPRLLIRPNILLVLFTLLAVASLVMSIRGYFGFGTIYRCMRLFAFVAVLWLTTPWWGRRGMLLCRFHCRALAIVLASVAIGLAVSPNRALESATGGRLGGILWPVPATQAAHYAAVFVGLTLMMWLAGAWRSRWTGLAVAGGLAVLLLTHTRTALVALLAGVLVGGLSLFLTRSRARKALYLTCVVAAFGALTLGPILGQWFSRGESEQQLTSLTGRTNAWTAVLATPRTEMNTLFGFGISNDSIDGLSIDSSWLSTYLDEGLIGDIIDGLVLLALLTVALCSPPGAGRAVALFLVVYCTIASFTETGLGQPSTYFLDLTVAMSALMPPLVRDRSDEVDRPVEMSSEGAIG